MELKISLRKSFDVDNLLHKFCGDKKKVFQMVVQVNLNLGMKLFKNM